MPRDFDHLERQISRAFERALADRRLDVADHLLQALEALDPEFERAPMRRACSSILEMGTAKTIARRNAPSQHLQSDVY